MSWGMEILSPSSYFSTSSWLLDESRSTRWTPAENKAFENALALFDENTPDRWQKVAAMVPGKTVGDVIRQYKELEDDVSSIEAGLIPVPGYATSSPFTLEWGSGHGYEGFKQSFVAGDGNLRRPGRPSKNGKRVCLGLKKSTSEFSFTCDIELKFLARILRAISLWERVL
ncbi:UNVERIFIED_CONTAM: Transcription factor DIVARICATA [Sesamum latifolium]|uniref:Transcription factor DIVARICATA n=1 Tax=Sesamum latifolium TaxID=2727402 RepID=A0AAW2Y0I0_9LAMI